MIEPFEELALVDLSPDNVAGVAEELRLDFAANDGIQGAGEIAHLGLEVFQPRFHGDHSGIHGIDEPGDVRILMPVMETITFADYSDNRMQVAER